MDQGAPQYQPPGPGYQPGPQGQGQWQQPGGQAQWAQPGMPGHYPPEDVEQGKALAIVGYLVSPLWIIPLLQRDNAFALFHAKQAMIYTIFMGILGAIISVVSLVTCGFGAILAIAIFPFMYPWIMAIVYAAQGQYKPMPWIGFLADKYFAGMVADKRPAGPRPA